MITMKVLGIGSPFGDDQIGWKVAEALAARVRISRFLSVESHDRPGIRLIELMRDADTVFIIDAIKSGNPAGHIHRFENDDVFDTGNSLSTHGFGLAQTLQLGKALDALPNEIILYGVEIDDISTGSAISQCVEVAIEQVVLLLKQDIERRTE